jgi:hypothetical protein
LAAEIRQAKGFQDSLNIEKQAKDHRKATKKEEQERKKGRRRREGEKGYREAS